MTNEENPSLVEPKIEPREVVDLRRWHDHHYYPPAMQQGYFPPVRMGIPPGQPVGPAVGQNLPHNIQGMHIHQMYPMMNHPGSYQGSHQAGTPGQITPNTLEEMPILTPTLLPTPNYGGGHPAQTTQIGQVAAGQQVPVPSVSTPGVPLATAPGQTIAGQTVLGQPVLGAPGQSIGQPVPGTRGQSVPGAPGQPIPKVPRVESKDNLQHSNNADKSHPNDANTSAAMRPDHVAILRSARYPRKRSHTACDLCRQKKIKCDNLRPQCGACQRTNSTCRYRADEPGADYLGFDAASVHILAKLDTILCRIKSSPTSTPRHRSRAGVWDMSLTSIWRWKYFQNVTGTTSVDSETHTKRLICDYEVVPKVPIAPMTISYTSRAEVEGASEAPGSESVSSSGSGVSEAGSRKPTNNGTMVESLLRHHLPTLINLFLVNCHTKVPCVDTVLLIEAIETYTMMKRADKSLSLLGMLDEFSALAPTEYVPQLYLQAVKVLGVVDLPVRQLQYRRSCECVPVVLVACAIGALATPIRLDNIGTFSLSMEERDADIGCVTNADINGKINSEENEESDSSNDKSGFSRYRLALTILEYARTIAACYPHLLPPNSLASVQYHILCSQFHHYLLNPLGAHREIVAASTDMMYLLQKHEKVRGADRLYWTCVKLECELRVELSPYVPLSGITDIEPPAPFMRIPDPLSEKDHLPECIHLSAKYDDQNAWLFFLTEIAMRKVDNKLCDEIYGDMRWGDDDFAETVWPVIIKYLIQQNGIVESLSPQIRRFVLLEVNVEQIYLVMKRRAARRDSDPDAVLVSLEEYLIDDDLLLRAHLELMMFIKTRILTSKMILFRPMLYLFLEDKIAFSELVEAAATALPSVVNPPSMSFSNMGNANMDSNASHVSGSHRSHTSDFTSTSELESLWANFLGEDPNVEMEPWKVARRIPEDNFSDITEYDADSDTLRITDHAAARQRLILVFVRNLVLLPKTNIPKIGLHRHAGSWYYVRNLWIGVMFQFLMFKKVQESIVAIMAETKPDTEMLETLNAVFNRDAVRASLEHTLLIINYWRDERQDVRVYGEYIERCLKNL